MANVVDFSQLRQKVTPWGSVIDPITEELQRRNAEQDKRDLQDQRDAPERAREERRLRLEEETVRHHRATEDLNDKRAVGEATMKGGDRRSKVENDIRAAIAAGELDRAQQMAASYQEMNAATGGVSQGLPGFKIDRGIEPSVPSPDSAKPGETVDSVLANPDSASITDPANDAAVKDWQRKQQHPDVMIAGVHTTPDALRYSAARANAADMQKTEEALQGRYNTALAMGDHVGAGLAQRELDDWRKRRTEVESGLAKPGEAVKANDAVAGAGAKAGDTRALQGEKDAAALARTNVNATSRVEAAKAGVGAREAAKAKDRAEGMDPKTYTPYASSLAKFNQEHNVTTDRNEETRASTLLANADKNVVQRAMATYLSRGLAGEKGALSNQDIQRIQGDLGGAWADVENWLSRKGSGSLDPAILEQLTAGVQTVLAEKQAKRALDEKAFEAKFLRPTSQAVKWGYRDDALNAFEEKFQHPYVEPQGAPAVHPQRDPSNPDDPNAPDAGRPLDGEASPPPVGKISREEAIQEARRRGLIK